MGGAAVEVDGSAGEGGGQILRTALTLSCVLDRPVRVGRIRAGRPNPGMRAQHVAAASALASVCGARTRGVHVGSTEVEFEPGSGGGDSGSIRCDVGTAGSTTLILTALAVAASLRGRPLEATLTGGTDVAWSPTADYASLALREALSRMGISFSMEVARRGYYPEGGGVVRASIEACEGGRPRPASLPGRLSRRAALRCSHAGLPAGRVAEALGEVAAELESAGCEVQPGWEVDAEEGGGGERPEEGPPAAGPRGGRRRRGGASAVAFHADGSSVVGADSLYRNGRFDAGGLAARFAAPGVGVDANLADMLVVPAALARGRSRFAAPEITGHLGTNLRVAADMTGCRYGVGRTESGAYEVVIDGRG